MAETIERPCRACGAPLLFIAGPDGKTLPLDKRAPTYEVSGDRAVRSAAYVSHFATCPEAGRFSKSKSAGNARGRGAT